MKFFSVSLLLFSTLCISAYADPQILYLTQYLNGTVYSVSNVEDGANLYVASNDSPASLNNIQVTTGGMTYRLSDLAPINPDGTPQKVTIRGGLQITSTNDDQTTHALSGYLYITTAQQAQDPGFTVYVITGTHHITSSATTVILNTQLKVITDDTDQPPKSTMVTNMMIPDANQTCTFHWGIPPAVNSQDDTNRFFMNPFRMITPGGPQAILFNNVEPFQIGLDYWYITGNGVSMDLQNTYASSHNTSATSSTTTGLMVRSSFLFDQHTVNLIPDPTHPTTVGTLITSNSITTDAKVSFAFNGNGGSFVQTFDKTTNTAQNVEMRSLTPNKFTVSSTDITAGVFYVQWFTYIDTSSVVTTAAPVTGSTVPVTGSNGPIIGASTTAGSTVSPATGTTPTAVTTATVGTTTSSVRSLSVLSSVIISLLTF